jgi:hypothetical protein
MPYLLRPSGIPGIWNVADFHLCMTRYALDRFLHAIWPQLVRPEDGSSSPRKECSGLLT